VDLTQLFNLRDDPDELHDLAGDHQFQDEVLKLTTLLRRAQRAYDDTLPLKVDTPAPATVDLEFFRQFE
jgi:hypothetical protein